MTPDRPTLTRCAWASSALLADYHDAEWGVPQHDDRALFELLILEGAQAGLSWETVLRKRPAYRAAFDNFDADAVAAYDEARIAALLANPGLIRHRGKIRAAVQNARALLALRREHPSFDAYLWGFVGGRPLVNTWRSSRELPAQTRVSQALSADLRRRGFAFVGPTICYALMQAAGLVNDHTTDCFRHAQLGG
jgi:DNA-3-methyladenine glycosylase I